MIANIWEIMPYEGVGKLKFGASCDEIIRLLESKYIVFQRGLSKTDVYHFIDLGILSYFNSKNKLEFMEFTKESKVEFDDISLFNDSFLNIVKKIEAKGYKAVKDTIGCDFESLGFGLYVPYDKVEAVSVYERDYYNLSSIKPVNDN